jgi:LCP family protein required for cell wall assembly
MFKKKNIIISITVFIVIIVALLAYKMGRTITIVSNSSDSFWEEASGKFPDLPKPEENRIDILMVGIRGYNGSGEWGNGEWLADTIILASFNKENNQASIVSIPRDLYVEIPGYGKDKINAVYSIGESKNYGGGGLQLMKAAISMISGVYVDYAVSVDFAGFQKIVDHIGGIVIYRNTPFIEDKQWLYDGKEGKEYWRLQDHASTTESGATTTEPGWVFYVPAGSNIMDSEDALYYARSRYSSSDFDRMRRQQEVISAIKSKALNLGVLANPVKIFNILDIVEKNISTDMKISDIKELISIAQKAKIQDIKREVLDSSEEGLLIEDRINGTYVLLPKGGNYAAIQALFKSVIEQ